VPSDARAAVVFAGAPLEVTARLRARVAALDEPRIVAADSGAATALAFGLRPDVVVGDFDSLDAETQQELARLAVPFERYPRAKDATDGQLALQYALEARPTTLLLLGYLNGPRLDMTLSAALLLAPTHTRAVLADERNECLLLRGPDHATWAAEPDELISLLPLAGDCLGVRTEGLRYPLDGERLVFGDTRGISNEPIAHEVSAALESGLLLLTRHFARL
jgi:thiamine pyrophosphokinase